jgi:hypothetical protein
LHIETVAEAEEPVEQERNVLPDVFGGDLPDEEMYRPT